MKICYNFLMDSGHLLNLKDIKFLLLSRRATIDYSFCSKSTFVCKPFMFQECLSLSYSYNSISLFNLTIPPYKHQGKADLLTEVYVNLLYIDECICNCKNINSFTYKIIPAPFFLKTLFFFSQTRS